MLPPRAVGVVEGVGVDVGVVFFARKGPSQLAPGRPLVPLPLRVVVVGFVRS